MQQTQIRPADIKARIEWAKRQSRKPDGFKWFVHNVFSAGFVKFIGGDYIDEVCERMEANDWSMDVTARDHFKSTRLYAEVMYEIFTTQTDIEAHYFSFISTMSRYHQSKIKALIANNPFFVGITDLNARSDSIIDYHNGKARYRCMPEGLLSFKRGIHADRIYVDDPLKDPENKLAPLVIHKINKAIKTELFPMVNKGGKCRVVGTPQTNDDFFFDVELGKKFTVTVLDAMKDEPNRVSLWPEWKSFDELIEIRNTIGERTFNQEYRATPAYSEDSFIARKLLVSLIDTDLPNLKEYTGRNDVVAGYDIGKHTHPAHFTAFERVVNGKEVRYKQLCSKWLDNWDYLDQLNFLVEAIGLFKISVLRYDNTRGEFEGFDEQNKVPKKMKPIGFTMKSKNAMAVNLDAITTSGRVTFINDKRQTDQILSVTSDLQAFETPEGHGDSFWSTCLALYDNEKQPNIRWL
jgi:hypothetical protein